MDNKIKFYKTRDLAESAALIIKGQELHHIDREGKTCWFVFNNPEHCTLISNNYFFGQLTVNAREFHETIVRLKNRIFAGI